MNYGFIIDNRKCIGCHACTVACKAEHETPIGVNRTWVKYIEKGDFPTTHRAFSVMRCNHCADAPCTTICPTAALYSREDGIVDFDNRNCIGCKACMQACPYDAIHIDPSSGTAAKCNYCAHRVEIGLEPPCVNVCPTHAILSGNLEDETSEIATLLALHPVQVRKPEKGTRPKLYYIEGDQASLMPSAAGGYQTSTLWSDAPPVGVDLDAWRRARALHEQEQEQENALDPADASRDSARPHRVYASAEPHRGSWGRTVSGYLFAKSLAAGAGLIAAGQALTGAALTSASTLAIGLLSLVFLGLTNFLLVYKLERRDRFYYVLTRPQWRSWLARGAFIMMAYGGTWTLVLLLTLAGVRPPPLLYLLVALAALGTAVYSAFLFNQAKGRDLWQSPVLPVHLLAHAAIGGAGALAFLPASLARDIPLSRILALGLAVSLLALGAEFFSKHATADGEAAARRIVSGPHRRAFWVGVFAVGHLLAIGLLSAGALVPGAACALFGMALFEDLFVQAGQSIPLA